MSFSEKFLVILSTILILIFFYNVRDFLEINFVIYKISYFKHLINNNLYVFTFIFILCFITWVSLFLPFISLLQIISGFIFGVQNGTIISLFSILLGSLIIYHYPIDRVKFQIKKVNKINYKILKEHIDKHELFYLLLIRVIPGFPFFLQGAVCSYFKVNIYKYIISTIFGLMPISYMINLFGSQVNLLLLTNKDYEINFETNEYYFLPLLVLLIIFFSKKIILKIFRKIFY